MDVQERHQPKLWVGVIAAALVLLALILVIVITLSSQMRRTQTATIIQPVPVEAAPTSPSTSPSSSASTTNTPIPAGAAPDAAAGTGTTTRTAPGATRVIKQPVIVNQPVKVVEKQVKVVEKQVQVVEKPVQVLQKQAPGAVSSTGSADTQPAADRSFQDTGLPNQITYNGKTWNASELVKGLPADLLIAGDKRVDGRTIFHDRETEAPYPHVYVKVTGQTDQYVRYVPTTS